MNQVYSLPKDIDIKIIGSDKSHKAIDATLNNLRNAGVEDYKYEFKPEVNLTADPMIRSHLVPKQDVS